MNHGESWRTISNALTEPGGKALPIGPGRWHILFGDRQRPLLMPAGAYHFQKRCLSYFVGNRLKALYAQTLLKFNALVPSVRLLPEFRLPRDRHGHLPCELPIRQPSNAAIQLGTSGPYQKASVLLMSKGGEGLALAKMAMVPTADRVVAVEAHWLKKLENMRKLAGQVPRLLAEGRTLNGRRYLVTTIAPSTRTTNSFTSAHLEFLSALGRSRLDTMRFRASPCLEYLERTLGQLESRLQRDAVAALQAALRDCRASLSEWSGPFVIAQGDFAPWNIRVHQQRVFVFDWEYARAGANPLGDVFNYFLIQRAVSGRRLGRRFLEAVMRRADGFAQQLYPEWAWRPRVVSALALAYLLEVLLHYSQASGHLARGHPVIENYWQLMEQRSTWLTA